MFFSTVNCYFFIGSILMLSGYSTAQSCYPYTRNSWLNCEHFEGTLKTDGIGEILEKIIFSKNQLSAIESASFSNRFKNIKDLDLDNNKIKRVSADAFKNLTNLEHINLSRNVIKTLSPKTFEFNTKLKVIDLSGNQLRVLNLALVRNLKQLKQFLLSNNPLGCDGETKQVLEYFEKHKITTYFLQSCDNTENSTVIANIMTSVYKGINMNETSGTSPINKSSLAKFEPLIIILGVMLLLVVALIIAVVAMFRKIFIKRDDPSMRARTESGNYLLQRPASSENPDLDQDGYLVPVKPSELPVYTDVFYSASDRPIPPIPSQPNLGLPQSEMRNGHEFHIASSSNENVLNHVYEEVQEQRSNYARNLERHLMKPYGHVRRIN